MTSNKVQELKDKGNECLKEKKYAEAVFHYTHAIQMDPSQYQLYSNRSLAFLKMDQYYLAYEDAKKTISLNPKWVKGYFRKAEVEFKTEHYEDALESYRKVLHFTGEDSSIMEMLRKSKYELEKQRRVDKQTPWIGAGIGFILGVLLILSDLVLRSNPFLTNPILMLLVVIVCSSSCYFIAKLHRNYLVQHRNSLLEEPLDILGDSFSRNHSQNAESSCSKKRS